MATRRQQQEMRRRLMRRVKRASRKTFRGCGVNPETGVAAVCYGVPFFAEQAERMSNAQLEREAERLEEAVGDDEPRSARERWRDGLMIAAPVMIFGALVYLSTQGPPRPVDWRDR
jgi:hypothetical protein